MARLRRAGRGLDRAAALLYTPHQFAQSAHSADVATSKLDASALGSGGAAPPHNSALDHLRHGRTGRTQLEHDRRTLGRGLRGANERSAGADVVYTAGMAVGLIGNAPLKSIARFWNFSPTTWKR